MAFIYFISRESNFFFVILFTSMLIATFACTKKKKFVPNTENTYKKVNLICQKTNASHFTVFNQKVNLKKSSKLISLNHLKISLPDGYYFCSHQMRNSSILD